MHYFEMRWKGPYPFNEQVIGLFPENPGLYVFTEKWSKQLEANDPRPSRDHPDYQSAMNLFRTSPCVLYVGLSKTNLRSRVKGYLLPKTDPKGKQPDHEGKLRPKTGQKGNPHYKVNKHKGRAWIHAHQYFSQDPQIHAHQYFSQDPELRGRVNPVFVWWTEDAYPANKERGLVEELNPLLNTYLQPGPIERSLRASGRETPGEPGRLHGALTPT